MLDYIFSHKNKEIYAAIYYEKDSDVKYYYKGMVLDFKLPDDLYNLIMDYDDILNGMALSLLDEVEEKIQEYDLRLKNANERIFCVVIKDKKICLSL